ERDAVMAAVVSAAEEQEEGQEAGRGAVASVVVKASKGAVEVGVAVREKRMRSDEEDGKKEWLRVYEFLDNEHLNNLESLLVQEEPAEVLFNKSSARLSEMLGRLKVPNRKCEAGKKELEEQDLLFLVGEDSLANYRAVCDLAQGTKALARLVGEEGLLNDEGFRGAFELERQALGQYMRLDAAAVDALNLFATEQDRQQGLAKEASVHGVLDRCMTRGLGSRLLRRWIRQPLVDMAQIEARQKLVAALKEDTTRRDLLRSHLRQVPDLSALIRKVEAGRGKLREMYVLYGFVQRLPEIATCLTDAGVGEVTPVDELRALGEQCAKLCEANRLKRYVDLVESVLDMSLAPREFRVQVQHDETGELAKVADRLQDVEDRRRQVCDELESNELSGMGARFEVDPGMQKTYKYHYRVKKSFDPQLSKLKGARYKMLNVVAAGIRWTTTGLQDLYDEASELTAQFNDAQAALVDDAMKVVETFLPLFEAAAVLVSQLDVLASLAHVAAYAPDTYVQPKLVALDAPTEERVLDLSGARHPCLEHLENVSFIPNDFKMGPESRFQIITGPNMGGKSTYIRQLGATLVMAQMGSFVPCQAATIPVVDAILARVGASDDQLGGVSTFMAEMVDASAIVKSATARSMVIIDELGRGTSTYDGFGLAWAISEHLAKEARCFCLFATHFHELTTLASQLPKHVKNKHVQAMATDEAITMLYNVQDGPCEQSFGINIAKMAGFPEDVIDTAKRKASQLEALTVIDASKRAKTETAAFKIVKAFAALDRSELNIDTLKQKIIFT
ncbi:DNA mismatch repair protein msh-2, partial [Durusdinium trenchii]